MTGSSTSAFYIFGVAETELERAQRHIAEGEMRIARQSALVDELKASGHARLAVDAERLLTEFLALQAEYERHAGRLADAHYEER